MTCLFTVSQFPCLLHGIAKSGDNLPHRVVVGILVLVYVKEMDAGLTGTRSALSAAAQDFKLVL